MKFCIILALAVILAAITTTASAQSHHITWGVRLPRDNLLKREIFRRTFKWLQIVHADLRFSSNKTITQIKVTDQYTNGKGGYATLLSGGPDLKNVVMHGKSKRGHGFNFIVDIYGI